MMMVFSYPAGRGSGTRLNFRYKNPVCDGGGGGDGGVGRIQKSVVFVAEVLGTIKTSNWGMNKVRRGRRKLLSFLD